MTRSSEATVQAEAAPSMRRELASIIKRFAPIDGEHRTAVPMLTLYRYSTRSELTCGISRSSLVIAAQGAKRVMVAGQAYDYGPTRCLITSVDLPMMSQITVASPTAPYLCLSLALDLHQLADLMADMGQARPNSIAIGKAIAVSTLPATLLDPAVRLLRLLDHPVDIPVLAPLIEREILFRLLTGEQGTRLRQLAATETRSNKVARAVDWLKRHYDEPLRIDELAQRLNMSVSSLHHHFKDVTAMSPLQYQKLLRLHEARRLLLQQAADVGLVASKVGYESSSQFSREYSRLFGAPPLRDVVRLRRMDDARIAAGA
jgi:AraC-like DNA-binding protein